MLLRYCTDDFEFPLRFPLLTILFRLWIFHQDSVEIVEPRRKIQSLDKLVRTGTLTKIQSRRYRIELKKLDFFRRWNTKILAEMPRRKMTISWRKIIVGIFLFFCSVSQSVRQKRNEEKKIAIPLYICALPDNYGFHWRCILLTQRNKTCKRGNNNDHPLQASINITPRTHNYLRKPSLKQILRT